MIENLKIHSFKLSPGLFIESKKLLIINQMQNSQEIYLCLHMREIKLLAIKPMLLLTIIKYTGGKRKQMDHHKLVQLSKIKKIKMVHKKLSTNKKINNKLTNKTGPINSNLNSITLLSVILKRLPLLLFPMMSFICYQLVWISV